MKYTDSGGMQVFDEEPVPAAVHPTGTTGQQPKPPDEKATVATLQEIAERLKKHFPGVLTSVALEAFSYTTGRAEAVMSVYIGKPRNHTVRVGSVDEAFAVLESILGTTPNTAGEHEIAAVDMGSTVGVPHGTD